MKKDKEVKNLDGSKRFYRTVIQVEVLSDAPFRPQSLDDVAYAIKDGDCSGRWEVKKEQEVSPRHMTRLLIAQGSDPEFLGLTRKGEIMYDGGEDTEDTDEEEPEA